LLRVRTEDDRRLDERLEGVQVLEGGIQDARDGDRHVHVGRHCKNSQPRRLQMKRISSNTKRPRNETSRSTMQRVSQCNMRGGVMEWNDVSRVRVEGRYG
jgi:hypothetical protein